MLHMDFRSSLTVIVDQINGLIISIHIILVPSKAGLLIRLLKYKHKPDELSGVAPIICWSAIAWLSRLPS